MTEKAEEERERGRGSQMRQKDVVEIFSVFATLMMPSRIVCKGKPSQIVWFTIVDVLKKRLAKGLIQVDFC